MRRLFCYIVGAGFLILAIGVGTCLLVKHSLYRNHHHMLGTLHQGTQETTVVHRWGPPRWIFKTPEEVKKWLTTGGYIYSQVLPSLDKQGKVLVYQTAFNTRIVLFVDAEGKVSRIIDGAT